MVLVFCHFSYSYTVSVVLIFSGQFIYRLFQHHSVIRKASGDMFAAAALTHGIRNSEKESRKQKRKRNPLKKVPSDRFENKLAMTKK